MDPITLLLLALGLGIVLFLYRSNQTTAAVNSEHHVPIPEGGLEAIEYFWRPG